MKKRSSVFCLVSLLLVLAMAFSGCGNSSSSGASGGGSAPQQSYTLTFANWAPAGNPFDKYYVEPFQRKLTEKTNGRVKIDYYPGGSLLEGGGILDGVIDGSADIGNLIMSWAPGRFDESGIFDMPGLDYASARAASYALYEYVNTYKPAEYDDFINMGVYCCGPGAFESKKTIRKLEDLKGLQIRSQSAVARGIAALGGTPVNMVSGEAYEGIRTGLLDANVGTTAILWEFALDELVDSVTLYPFFNTTFIVLMNKEKFNSLPDDIQKALLETRDEIFEETLSYYFDVEVTTGLAAAKAKGIEVIELDDAELARWRAAVSNVLDEYAADLDAKGLDGQLIKSRAVELAAKYNAIYPTMATKFDWE